MYFGIVIINNSHRPDIDTAIVYSRRPIISLASVRCLFSFNIQNITTQIDLTHKRVPTLINMIDISFIKSKVTEHLQNCLVKFCHLWLWIYLITNWDISVILAGSKFYLYITGLLGGVIDRTNLKCIEYYPILVNAVYQKYCVVSFFHCLWVLRAYQCNGK